MGPRSCSSLSVSQSKAFGSVSTENPNSCRSTLGPSSCVSSTLTAPHLCSSFQHRGLSPLLAKLWHFSPAQGGSPAGGLATPAPCVPSTSTLWIQRQLWTSLSPPFPDQGCFSSSPVTSNLSAPLGLQGGHQVHATGSDTSSAGLHQLPSAVTIESHQHISTTDC